MSPLPHISQPKVIAFVECLFRATSARTCCIIAPVNIIQNFADEFSRW